MANAPLPSRAPLSPQLGEGSARGFSLFTGRFFCQNRGAGSPVSVSRQTASASRVWKLTPVDTARARTPPRGQCPAGRQLHTLMVSVVVLDRAGEPLSATTTGRTYWVRSRRLKELRRATMPAVLSEIRRRGGHIRGKACQTGNKTL